MCALLFGKGPLHVAKIGLTVATLTAGKILTVATEVAFGQGEVPVIVYVKVEFDVPTEGVNMPVAATNVPPVPVVRVHVPPVC